MKACFQMIIRVFSFNDCLRQAFRISNPQEAHAEKNLKKIFDNLRITLKETEDDPVVTICNIIELSNHYK